MLTFHEVVAVIGVIVYMMVVPAVAVEALYALQRCSKEYESEIRRLQDENAMLTDERDKLHTRVKLLEYKLLGGDAKSKV